MGAYFLGTDFPGATASITGAYFMGAYFPGATASILGAYFPGPKPRRHRYVLSGNSNLG